MLKDGANRSTPIMGKLANGVGGGDAAVGGGWWWWWRWWRRNREVAWGLCVKEECLEMPGVRWVRGIRGSLYLWDPSTALTRELVVTGAFEVVDGERRDRGGGVGDSAAEVGGGGGGGGGGKSLQP